ncbi:hypothetical protein CXF68_19030 [Tenacibaculum sp. Bg11-29]|uniref:hypothetical protein n=1 Tax=Tenacibaculum sp. Bg11-29 TaxID=2058306 RepID=UPI000C31E4E9|nr:hypothetical protein [Tenacibaculum sp. Bg11-29]PKH52667.1 hypothetical protein CXF68_19030 [Tenacibaculum sp. Bg11-29]
MTKAIIEKEIFINEVVNDNNTSGYLTIKSYETITLDKIMGVIFLEARGRMSSYKDEVLSFKISDKKELIKNESSKIPFTFNSSNFEINSYNGKNVSFSYNLEIQIDVNDNDLERLEKNIFSQIKSFITSDYTIKISKYFKIENLNINYQVVETETDFNIQTNLIVGLFTLLIFGSTYAYLIPEFNPFYIILGIACTILLTYLITKYIGSSLGTISMKTLKDENAFICKILKTKKFNLIKPSLYYVIIEKVIDNRGTSSSTYTETIFTSEKKKLENFKSSPEIKFLYPNKNGLQSYEYKDASILWQMKLEGKYLGLMLKYKCTFRVERK